MHRDEILSLLMETDAARLAALWARADAVRRTHVGDAVHLRGLIEVSNICVRHCAYCGIAACAPGVERYRMSQEEVLACAGQARAFDFGTVVLQAGEDPGLTRHWVAETIRAIAQRTGLAITLSLGERPVDDLRTWLDAGADRYLLRFETTDHALYERIHPSFPDAVSDRFAQLRRMRALGFEIGTGIMVGLPGQTWDTLANDVLAFREHDMDMIGLGPYIPSPGTPLHGPLGDALRRQAGTAQVPNDALATLKVLAVTRLICPDTNIPSTTALSTIDPTAGLANGLRCGANVLMPNLTPPRYRALYRIYPGKAGVSVSDAISAAALHAELAALGRFPGTGPGTSPRRSHRASAQGHRPSA